MLPTGSRCRPEAWASICRNGNSRVLARPGSYVSSASSRRAQALVAQRHDRERRERLRDRADHELGVVGAPAWAATPSRAEPTWPTRPACPSRTTPTLTPGERHDALGRDDPGQQVPLEPGRQAGSDEPPTARAARSLRRPQAHRAVDDGVVLAQRDRLDPRVEQLAPRLAEVALGVALGGESRSWPGPPPPSGCRGRRGTARTSQHSCRHPSWRARLTGGNPACDGSPTEGRWGKPV